jgi:hypothetical protein
MPVKGLHLYPTPGPVVVVVAVVSIATVAVVVPVVFVPPGPPPGTHGYSSFANLPNSLLTFAISLSKHLKFLDFHFFLL